LNSSTSVVLVQQLLNYSIKQFVKLPLQQGSHAACSLVYCHCIRAAVCIHACSLLSCHCSRVAECSAHSCMQFGILPFHYSDWSLRTAVRTSACAYMQFENLPLQPGSSYVAARVCLQRGGRNFRPVNL
jgi:hypothetical protein